MRILFMALVTFSATAVIHSSSHHFHPAVACPSVLSSNTVMPVWLPAGFKDRKWREPEQMTMKMDPE